MKLLATIATNRPQGIACQALGVEPHDRGLAVVLADLNEKMFVPRPVTIGGDVELTIDRRQSRRCQSRYGCRSQIVCAVVVPGACQSLSQSAGHHVPPKTELPPIPRQRLCRSFARCDQGGPVIGEVRS